MFISIVALWRTIFADVLFIYSFMYFYFSCLQIFVAVGLPTLASNDQSVYQPALAGYENNIHCIATAVNQLSAVIFTVIGYCTVQERMHEFLAVCTTTGISITLFLCILPLSVCLSSVFLPLSVCLSPWRVL